MTDATAAKRRLVDIVRDRSFSTGGETKLVSGRSTTFYFGIMQQTHLTNEISGLQPAPKSPQWPPS